MKTEKLQFAGSLDHAISALLNLPDGEPRGYILFAHCFTCSKNYKILSNFAKVVTEAGYGVLRFDFTGLGESEGDFAETSFTTNLEDLVAASTWLGENRRAPTLLIGHSLGGAAVLAAAHRIESARCVATVAAPSSTMHVRKHISVDQFDEAGTAEVKIGGRPFRIGKQLIDDLEEYDLLERVKQLHRPLLVFHSPHDDIVDIEHGKRIFDAANFPKGFVSLDKADHLCSDRESASLVANTLLAWVQYAS